MLKFLSKIKTSATPEIKANGERIIKKSELGETQYVSANYIVRNKTVISKHVFAGNQRIASTVSMKNNCGTMTEQNTMYFHPDHLGSSSYVTDKKGNFFEMIEYLPYGETLYDEAATVDKTEFRFTGHLKDDETGFYYCHARYYDPKIGKFISADDRFDDLYSSAGLNIFSYCHNNPINMVDPDGHIAREESYAQWRCYPDDQSEAKYFKAKVLDRGGKWDDKGVNVVGVRDSSTPAKTDQQKANDLFVVINNNQVQGYFRGTTEPGVESWTDSSGNTSGELGGVAHLNPGDYTYKFMAPISNEARSHGYFNSVGALPVTRDFNENGKISSFEKKFFQSTSLDIQFHWMGRGSFINGYSHGCQGVKGKFYLNGNGVRNSASDAAPQLGAYDVFVQQAGARGIMNYHLFEVGDINQGCPAFKKLNKMS